MDLVTGGQPSKLTIFVIVEYKEPLWNTFGLVKLNWARHPLIISPAATIGNKGAQYDKSRFNASKFTMSDQTNFPVGEKRLDW